MELVHWIEAFTRVFMCLFGILGNNWLGFRSLPRRRSPLRTNELLLLNLAVSNLITNCMVDLPDTMSDFAGEWFLGRTYCGLFLCLADLSETCSIFSTFFISVFWYQKLVGSLKRGGAPVSLDNLRLVTGLLVGSWTVALVFSIPHFFFAELEGENGSHRCVEYYPSETAQQTYDALYLTLANAIPIAGTMFASLQIVVTLLQNRMRVQQQPTTSHQPTASAPPDKNQKRSPTECPPHQIEAEEISVRNHTAEPPQSTQPPAKPSPGPSSQVRAAKSVVAVATVFLVCWMTHLLLRISSIFHTSDLLVEIANYVAGSYTSIIPYIFLYGIKQLSCSCRR